MEKTDSLVENTGKFSPAFQEKLDKMDASDILEKNNLA
jgi:hypothetical protein